MLSDCPFTDTVEEIFVLGGTEVYRVNTLFALPIHECTLDMGFYTMPLKSQPIRMHGGCCIPYSTVSHPTVMRRMYVALIVLTTVFSMAWYKIVMQCPLMVYHRISQKSL